MKKHTQNFKSNISRMGKQLDSIISYELNGEKKELGNSDLNSVTPHYQGNILKSVMKQLEIDSNVDIPINTVINYKFGVAFNGSDYEYLDFGNYIVFSSEKQEDTRSYKIICYDKMLYSMKNYEKFNDEYPISINDFFDKLCTKLGLKFVSRNMDYANKNMMIDKELYLDNDGNDIGFTYRDVMDELAQVTASTVVINENDEVEIRYIKETDDVIDEEYLKDVNVNFGEKYGPVNSIVLSRAGDSDKIYLRDEASVAKNGVCELNISENQIMNFNNRDEFLPAILAKLNGLEYYINDFVSTGICYYDICDRYTVKIGDMNYSCVMLNDEVNVTQGLKEQIYTETPDESVTDYNKADKTDRKINQTTLIVDKQNQTIEGLITNVKDNTEKIVSMDASLNGITTRVSTVETGLKTTNSNLEQTNKNVSDLNSRIDGVSANFEDFKDNEYIKSIENLQDQIDGLIQLWEGTEKPTLTNYPANEWETDKDKKNHVGDIFYLYGKDEQGNVVSKAGYRFAYIDNVYQWVLLSDEELAAVEKLAQDALNKANKNADDIGILNKKTSELEQTDSQIRASVEEINNRYEHDMTINKTVEGNNHLYIPDALESNALDYKVFGKSYQKVTEFNGQYCPPVKEWTLNNGAYLDNEGYIVLPNDNSEAFIIFEWNYANNYGYLKAKVNSNASDFRVHADTRYLNEKKEELSGNGNAPIITSDYYRWTFGGTTADVYGIALKNAKYVKIGFTRSSYASYEYRFKDVAIGATGYIEDYVEFIPNSPSPEFPSEVQCVDGVENLFDYDNSSAEYQWNTQATKENNGYTIKASSGTAYTIIGPYYSYKQNRIYTVNFKTEGDFLQVGMFKDSNTVASVIYGEKVIRESTFTFTTTSEDYKLALGIYCRSNSSCRVYDIQIEEGSTLHPYVPFGTYLPINVTGKNLLLWDKIISDSSDERITKTNDGYIKFYQANVSLIIKNIFKNNTQYTFTIVGKKEKNNSELLLSVNYTDETKEYIRLNCINAEQDYTTYLTTKINKTIDNIIGAWSDGSVSYLKIEGTQLEEGSQSTSYEPYKEKNYYYPLNKNNLMNESQLLNATGWTLNDEGYYNGTMNAFEQKFGTNTDGFSFDKSFKEDTQYTILFNAYVNSGYGLIRVYYNDNTYSNIEIHNTISNQYIFTSNINKTISKIIGSYGTGSLSILYIKDFKIYEGTDSNDSYELCKIGDVEDELDIVNGKLIKRIGKVVLDGSESWSTSTSEEKHSYWINVNLLPNWKNDIFPKISNYFKYEKVSWRDGSSQCICENSIDVSVSTLFIFRMDNITTLNDWKAWLKEKYDSGNPVKVYYELADSYTIDLKPFEIGLFENINHVNLLEDLETKTSMTYLTNTALNAQYATRAELKITADGIKNEVNKRVTIDDFENALVDMNSTIDQKADSITSSVSQSIVEVNNKISDTNAKFNDYAQEASVTERFNSVEQKITSSEASITIIKKTLEDGIDSVTTQNNFTFNENGLNIGSSETSINNTLDEYGMKIKQYNTELLFAGYDTELQQTIVRSENMNINKYLTIPGARYESYNNPKHGRGTGCFYKE